MNPFDVFAFAVLAVGCIACAVLGLGLLGLALGSEEPGRDLRAYRLPLTPPPQDRTAPAWIRAAVLRK